MSRESLPGDWMSVNLSIDLPDEEIAALTTAITSISHKCVVTTPKSRYEMMDKMPQKLTLVWTVPADTSYMDIWIENEYGARANIPTVAEWTMWGEIYARFPLCEFDLDRPEGEGIRITYGDQLRRIMVLNGPMLLCNAIVAGLQMYYLGPLKVSYRFK